MKKNKLRNLGTIISRIAVTAISLILQILWIVTSVMSLSAYSNWIDMGLRLLSLLAILYIICKDDNPSYKIIWIILILVVPILGGFMYLFAGNKKPSKKMHRKIENSHEKLVKEFEDDSSVREKMSGYAPRHSETFSYVRNISGYPCRDDSTVKYYPLGDDMYKEILEEVSKAKRYIFLEYFIIAEGDMWDRLLKILIDKADSGVEVRIIYDDMGCIALLPPHYGINLEKEHPNIKCLAFNPAVPVLSLVMNNRDHRKILVIDGHTAFSGGVNISDEYINVTHPFGHWKDTGTMIKGKAAMNFCEMFLEMWHAFRDCDKDFKLSDYEAENYPALENTGIIQPFYDTPLDREALSENLYIDILNAAEKYVYIYTPYLILDDNMKNALCLAAKRGVDVRIVTPGIPDKKAIYRLTRANYKPLLEAGVRIFEYAPGFIHAKSFAADDKIAVVGTINLDYRSLFLHFECGTLFYGCEAVKDLRRDCEETFEKCREITKDNVKNYFKGTMFDALFRLLAPLL
ncbi:MAG: cardiolipin synthase [Ruminococcus sp.]|nr:cardiolipin synthase [Ruminococcus sp.]